MGEPMAVNNFCASLVNGMRTRSSGCSADAMKISCCLKSCLLAMAMSMLAIACTPASNQASGDQERSSPSAFRAYFPAGAVTDFQQRWFASDLSAMKEPVLSATGKSQRYFALRILFLPAWGRPVAIRYEANGLENVYRAVMLSGDRAYGDVNIMDDMTSVPQQVEMKAVSLSLERSGYWSLPEKDHVDGKDGDQLIIETIRDGKYRVLVRWSPSFEANNRKLDRLVSFYLAEFKKAGLSPQHDAML